MKQISIVNLINKVKYCSAKFLSTRNLLILILLIILTGLFYWIQIRPSQIKQNCSWIKAHKDAVAAVPPKSAELTSDEVIQCYVGCDKQFKKTSEITDSSFKNSLCLADCDQRGKSFSGYPAEPAKDWLEPTMKEEYDFCLHSHGL
jgi:hypothetical protein